METLSIKRRERSSGAGEGSLRTSSMRFLPHSLLATAAVVVIAPLVVAPYILGRFGGGAPRLAVAAAGIGLSIAINALASRLWRRFGSREIVFGELMLWNWMRLVRGERRLVRTARLLGIDRHGNRREEAKLPPERLREVLVDLSSALEAKDPYTLGHSKRVARYAYWIAVKMDLPAEQVAAVRGAAEIHDVGKIHVPDEVLRKPGKLTDAEYGLMKQHSAAGAELVSQLDDERITAIVRSHHERWDGRGYPDGIPGEDIPVGARIIAVADTYDAITTSRSYRAKSNHAKAITVLQEEAGKQFDPVAVDAFVSHLPDRSVGFVAVLTSAPWRLFEWFAGLLRSGAVAGVAQGAIAAGAIALIGGTALVSLAGDESSIEELRAEKVAIQEESDPSADPQRPASKERTSADDGRGGERGGQDAKGSGSKPPADGTGTSPSDPGGSGPSSPGDYTGPGESPGSDGSPGSGGSDPIGGVIDDTGDVIDDIGGEIGDTVDDVEDEIGDIVDDVGGVIGDTVDDVDGLELDDIAGGPRP